MVRLLPQVRPDAEKEFDRTMDYINATIKAAKELHNAENNLTEESGILAMVRMNTCRKDDNDSCYDDDYDETRD